MSDLTVILPCAGEGTRLSLPYPKEVHSIEKNKSLIDYSFDRSLTMVGEMLSL